MHTRRLITFLLGAWSVLLLSTGFVASMSVRVAGNTAKEPPAEAARALHVIGEPVTEQTFRFLAMEINRTLLEAAGLLELLLVLAIALLLFLQNYSRAATLVCTVMLLAALASHFLLTPQLIAQGRLLDFRPAELMLADRARLDRLHLLFGAVSLFRVACGTAIAFLLLRRGNRRRGQQVHEVNYAQHGHIDG